MMTILASGILLLVQAGTATVLQDHNAVETAEVAFEAMDDGRNAEAIAELERLLDEQPEDPALLINLGAVYA